MEYLTKTSFLLVKREVDDMTVEEALDIWKDIEPFFVGICARAGHSKAVMEWNMLVRKMNIIQNKAKGDE